MICKTCGLAGDLMAVGRKEAPYKQPRNTGIPIADAAIDSLHEVNILIDKIEDIAEWLHSICGNKCDCQHKVDWKGSTIQS